MVGSPFPSYNNQRNTTILHKNEIDIPTDFKHYEIPVKKAKAKAESLFAIGGVRDLNKEGCEIFIKNIAFYDAKGNEIVPEYN